MKKLLSILGLVLSSLFGFQSAYAQELVEDQNPNYKASLSKYMAAKDSLTATLSTTVQDTYKAYDWYEAKQERKAQKREYRHEERMARAKNRSYNNGYYNNGYYNNGYYGNGYYGSSYYNNSWNWLPRIGYRTGNWMFSI